MRSLLILVFILSTVCFYGQKPSSLDRESPFIPFLLNISDSIDENKLPADISNSIVSRFVAGQDIFKIGFQNNLNYKGSSKEFYVGIIDIQPDGYMNLLVPIPGLESKMLYQNSFDDLVTILPPEYMVVPPFGTDVLVFLFSENPIDFLKILYSENGISKDALINGINKDDIKWILQNQPPEILKNVYFTTLLFEIYDLGEIHGSDTERSKYSRCSGMSPLPECPLITVIDPLILQNQNRGVYTIEKSTLNHVVKGLVTLESENINVLVNGSIANVKPIHPGKQYWWEKQISIGYGDNQIVVEAQSNDSLFSINEFSIQLIESENETGEYEIKSESKNHLVLIGINEYLYWPKLKSPTIDIEDFKKCLHSKYNFDEVYTYSLINEQATFKNIDNLFRELSSKVQDIDNVVVYFAGHGALDKEFDEGYWVPVEGDLSDFTTLIPNERVRKWMQRLKSKHTLFIADACFSGSYYTEERGVNSYIDRITDLASKWAFTSGREEAVADRLAGTDNSPFAYYLIKFLNENDSDQLLISDLANMVTKAVSNNSEQLPLAAPIRNAGDEGGQFVFELRK